MPKILIIILITFDVPKEYNLLDTSMNLRQKIGMLIGGFKSHQHGNLTIHGINSLDGILTGKNDTQFIKQGYSLNAQLYSIIRKIAETGSDIPWIIEDIQREGKTKEILEGKFFEFINMPNEDQTLKDFKENSYSWLLTTGDLFWETTAAAAAGEAIRDIVALPSQLTQIIPFHNDPLEVQKYELIINNQKRTIPPEEIIHLKYFNPTEMGIISLRGMSPLEAGWRVLQGDNDVAESMANMIKNKGAAGILSNEGEYNLTPEEQEKGQKTVDKMIGGAQNFNKAHLSPVKAKWIQLGMSPTDLKILESGTMNLRALCNTYGADSSLFNDPKNKTFNNQKEAMKAFYNNAVIPVENRLIRKFNMKIVPAWSEMDNKNYKIRPDLSKIAALQEDEAKKAARNEKTVNSIMKVVAQVNNGLSPDAASEIIAHSLEISKEDALKFVILETNKVNEGDN